MPVYVFGCGACGHEQELLRPLGDLTPPSWPACGGPTRHKLARVAVKYDAFGFTTTDNLAPNPSATMKALREKAEHLADS